MGKTIVIKIGSSVLFTKRGKLDEYRMGHIAQQILALKKTKYKVVLVISGAVACGARLIKDKQAAAGIGQVILTSTLYEQFKLKELLIAQLLLTKFDFSDLSRKEKLKRTLSLYLQSNIIPTINENDVIELNSFAGNDFLATELSVLLNAPMLMLSRWKGSQFSIGGGQTKTQAQEILSKNNISMQIVDGGVKNIILKSIL